MSKLLEFKKAPRTSDDSIDWNDLGPVHTEILEELCNDLWQLVHPGRENDWDMPAEVYEAVKERLNRPKEVNVKAEYVPPKEMKIKRDGIQKMINREIERKLQAYADGEEEL